MFLRKSFCFLKFLLYIINGCYRLNVCVPVKFMCWNLIPNVIVFGGSAFTWWLGHEDGALMSGISGLEKETLESSLIPFTMWGHSKKTAICEPGGGFSPDTGSKGVLMLDFPASRAMKNKFMFFISYPVYGMYLL